MINIPSEDLLLMSSVYWPSWAAAGLIRLVRSASRSSVWSATTLVGHQQDIACSGEEYLIPIQAHVVLAQLLGLDCVILS